jgi:hypothetical protein
MTLAQLQSYLADNTVSEATLNFNYGGTVSLEFDLGPNFTRSRYEEFELTLDNNNSILAFETVLEAQSFPMSVFHG